MSESVQLNGEYAGWQAGSSSRELEHSRPCTVSLSIDTYGMLSIIIDRGGKQSTLLVECGRGVEKLKQLVEGF